ncbi:MarR family winged helix-turn-helix transcriptional regulator [Salinicoccus roseus]|uniref:MarR family winged helix-turn-helix transcriptional regulator n=1 Tax=Salinicoccus roseus TaxID=45670 RepID=UPI000F4F086B|nr:winged helix DNA-binding protein [Salinicoccus roseus]RPE52929.1 MarR family transcriptional regulator [Salinicoccus roseus]GGA72190.1 MarR family transcriptional regulator [Salinicoccus roseus]
MRIEQEFFDAYMAIHRPYINRANSILSTYNLYSSQWLILKDIAKKGKTTSVDVSRRRGIEKPTATKVIKHLLELDLIESTPGEDRRIKYLTMTEKGKHLFDEVSDKMNHMQREVLEDFEIEEVEELIMSLRRMNI